MTIPDDRPAGDTGPLRDLQRWGIPGRMWVQTVRSASAGFPGWMVHRSDGLLMVSRATEEHVLAWLNEHGYTRRPGTA